MPVSNLYSNPTHKFYNLPIKVWWEGWRSDTLMLQQHGWLLSVDEDIHRNQLRIAMKHPKMHLCAFSDYMEYAHKRLHYSGPMAVEEYLERTELKIISIAPRIQLEVLPRLYAGGDYTPRKFHPIDAEPSVVTWNSNRIIDMEDFAHFKVIQPDREIIVPEQSVSDLLQEILKKQAPEQERYRKRIQEEARLAKGREPEKIVQAQIITLRQAA